MQELAEFLDCIDDSEQLLFYSSKAREVRKDAPAKVSSILFSSDHLRHAMYSAAAACSVSYECHEA
jgi:hypothetical protein